MANKRIETAAPNSVRGVQRRVELIRRESEDTRMESFNALVLDTLTGIAQGPQPQARADDPVETAREVLRYGAELYAEHGGAEFWITWDEESR